MTLMFKALHIGISETIHRLCLQANVYVREFCGSVHSLHAYVCKLIYVLYICIDKPRPMCAHVSTFKPI